MGGVRKSCGRAWGCVQNPAFQALARVTAAPGGGVAEEWVGGMKGGFRVWRVGKSGRALAAAVCQHVENGWAAVRLRVVDEFGGGGLTAREARERHARLLFQGVQA